MKKFILVTLLFTISTLLFAQTDTVGRFSISLSGGAAIPLGSYKSIDADPAAIYFDTEYSSNFIGFSKETSGFANTGYSINLDVRYRLLNKWYANARIGHFENGINASPMEDWFVQEILDATGQNATVYCDHTDVIVSYIAPGFGYIFKKGKLIVDLGFNAGWGKCNYPGYLFTFGDSPNQYYFGQRDETPDLSDFVFGFNTSLNYTVSKHLLIGLEFAYFQAGFDYSMTNVSYPGGGSPGRPFDDTILIRTFNPGIKMGYAF